VDLSLCLNARPKTGEVHWLILPSVGAQAFSLALEHFAREVGAGVGKRKRILLVLDRAGWHTAKKRLRVPEGIHLEFLPSHSPELQPSERLWALSNEGVANRHFEEIEELEEALVERCVALCATNPSSSATTSATTGGQRQRENQGYSNGLGITTPTCWMKVTVPADFLQPAKVRHSPSIGNAELSEFDIELRPED
jgi:transposase